MSNYENRHPQRYAAGHPIHEIMRAVCGMPGPYDPEDPELLQIRYEELVAILEDKLSIGQRLSLSREGPTASSPAGSTPAQRPGE